MSRARLRGVLPLAILVCLFLAGVGRAEDPPQGGEGAQHTEGAAAGDHKEGDDHKAENPISLAEDLGFYTLIVFGLLFCVLKFFPLPGAGKSAWDLMIEGLRNRESTIHRAITEAEQARAETQEMRKQLEAELAKANEKVAGILDQARRSAEQVKEEMLNKARSDIQAERERGRREIEMARDQALQEIWNQQASLAVAVSAGVLRREMKPEDQRRLVDEALAELKQAGQDHQRQTAGLRT
jgi:F-type H+-transporting ATPase subunit b